MRALFCCIPLSFYFPKHPDLFYIRTYIFAKRIRLFKKGLRLFAGIPDDGGSGLPPLVIGPHNPSEPSASSQTPCRQAFRLKD